MPKQPNFKHEVEDSASAPVDRDKSSTPYGPRPKGKGSQGRGKNVSSSPYKSSNASGPLTESIGPNSQTPGFADGNTVLQSYGLSVSGRRERILSPFKADKFFHFVSDAWHALVDTKPHIEQRFSFAEFRHASALQLYSRLEQVKFDTLGIKPSASTRIPLPRNTRVFQPLWSILSNIGRVDDDDLRVTYVPDGILPKTDDLTDPEDIENLLSCVLYDWSSSWDDVLASRKTRRPYVTRTGMTENASSNESPSETRENLIRSITSKRQSISTAQASLRAGKSKEISGSRYMIEKSNGKSPSDEDLIKTKAYYTVDDLTSQLQELYTQAKAKKEEMITPRFDTTPSIHEYRIADGTVTADPGVYGSDLHWDPQLWLEYEQFVEDVSPVAMFSLSMPVETSGTYAWLLPTESVNNVDVFCKMPKASIAPVTWILALLLQSSTLPPDRRSTFYVETDRLVNVQGLRIRYVRSAIKRAAPTEQYGTY
jgi:hypothetical protein